jgi:tetratricopeptide (TPR) repeat protein
VDSSEQPSDERADATGLARLAEERQRAGDHESAIRLFERSLALLRQTGHLGDIGSVLNHMAASDLALGRRQDAARCLARAIEIRRDLCDHVGLAASLHDIGILHCDAGLHAQAREAFEESHEIRSALGDRIGLSRTELRLGMLHENQGDHGAAIACYERARNLASDTRGTPVDEQAQALQNLAGVLVAQGKSDEALPLLAQAASIYERTGTQPGAAAVQFTLGLARATLGHLPEAFAALSQASVIQLRCRDHGGLGATYAALGVICACGGDLSGAQAWLADALRIQTDIGNAFAQVSALRLLARVAQQQGDHDAAARHLAMAAETELHSRRSDAPQPAMPDFSDHPGTSAIASAAARRFLQ